MTATKPEESNKWISGIIIIGSLLCAYVVHALLKQFGEWFDLEARLQYFLTCIQITSVLLGLIVFALVRKNNSCVQYLDEVYSELTKVVWADKDSTIKLTIGIIIGVIITSILLGIVDFSIGKLFRLLF